jgi:hypothetical protein
MSYVPPSVVLSETVLFAQHEGAPCVPAIVTRLGSRTLEMYALGGAAGGVMKVGVHHESDPDLENFPEWKKSGIWKKAPADPKYAILAEKVALLEKKLESLGGKKG